MDELNILARDIIQTIEREDFLYAMKHYGSYKSHTLAKDVRRWLLDEN